jgi:hypothetical protein
MSRIPTRTTHSDEQIIQIRRRFQAGDTLSSIALDFNTALEHVWQVVHGKCRQSVGGPIAPSGRGHLDARRLSIEDAADIRRLFAAGVSGQALADKYEVGRTTIRRIYAGWSYKEAGGPSWDEISNQRWGQITQRPVR